VAIFLNKKNGYITLENDDKNSITGKQTTIDMSNVRVTTVNKTK